jgi:hypothetical protein
MFAVAAYMVRGLQLMLGSSKRAITERAEEMGNEDDVIPLADSSGGRRNPEITLNSSLNTPGQSEDLANDLIFPQRTQDPSLVRGTGGPPESDVSLHDSFHLNAVPQTPLTLTRPQRWAAFINLNFDRITYSLLFLFVGIPIYYSTGYVCSFSEFFCHRRNVICAFHISLTSDSLSYFD